MPESRVQSSAFDVGRSTFVYNGSGVQWSNLLGEFYVHGCNARPIWALRLSMNRRGSRSGGASVLASRRDKFRAQSGSRLRSPHQLVHDWPAPLRSPLRFCRIASLPTDNFTPALRENAV